VTFDAPSNTPWRTKMGRHALTTGKVRVADCGYVLSLFCKTVIAVKHNVMLPYAAPQGVLYCTRYEERWLTARASYQGTADA
jgi:hypothetical protein